MKTKTPYNFAAQKAALTRAMGPCRRNTATGTNAPPTAAALAHLKAVCKKAVAEWNAYGPWPDDWARWQRALDDAYDWGAAPRLEDL